MFHYHINTFLLYLQVARLLPRRDDCTCARCERKRDPEDPIDNEVGRAIVNYDPFERDPYPGYPPDDRRQV
jgi:hypothetical protein